MTKGRGASTYDRDSGGGAASSLDPPIHSEGYHAPEGGSDSPIQSFFDKRSAPEFCPRMAIQVHRLVEDKMDQNDGFVSREMST